VDGIENLENYNPYAQNVKMEPNNERGLDYDDPEFQKYYEEYLRNQQNPQNELYNQQKEIPSNENLDVNVEAIERKMQNLNIQKENYGSNSNTSNNNQGRFNSKRNESDIFNSKPREIITPTTYKTYVDPQNNLLQNANNVNYNKQEFDTKFNPRLKVKKEVEQNPYSTKNYQIGGSGLSVNPITNPVNSYVFNGGKANNNFNKDNQNRGDIIRNAGNKIFN